MAEFTVKEPSTIYISFTCPLQQVNVFFKDQIYFFRVLNGKYTNIKFNVCHAGTYKTDRGIIDKIVPIEIEPLNFDLPVPDRNRMKEFKIIHNPNLPLTGTPARNFTHKGIIETGLKYKTLPFPIRLFILLHEIAHFYYKDEEKCDLWAAKMYVQKGYNNSMAYYSLSMVLNCVTDRNQDRLKNLFNHLNK